jgi:hypothetical protein
MPRSIRFAVLGTPAPKGSSRAMTTKTGEALNVPSGSRPNAIALADWGGAVRNASLAALGAAGFAGSGTFFGKVPLRLRIEFRMRRPVAHFNKKNGSLSPNAPRWHITTPDASKLLRATEDAMIGLILLDDRTISEPLVRKVYALPDPEGAIIHIEELE